MMKSWKSRAALYSGLIVLLTVFTVGVARAYTRGGHDFLVFYEAWRLVLKGAGARIYIESPDRFLYCPGFAWILAPLGLLPHGLSLAFWCAAKFGVLAFLIHTFSSSWKQVENREYALALTIWGMVSISRPLLIDLEYGQINLLILGVCVWSIRDHVQNGFRSISTSLSWFLLGLIAIAKVFPLPLVLIPWFVIRGVSSRKLKLERFMSLAGVGVGLFLPIVSEGFGGGVNLLLGWKNALLSKGLPLESHNQSFSAFLYHYLSGHPTQVISEGVVPLFFGSPLLSLQTISLLSLSWAFLMMSALLGWIVSGSNHPLWKWMAILIGLMIVPSHLVWKPYFVMSIPLSVYLIQTIFGAPEEFRKVGFKNPKLIVLLIFFMGINFTSFDFLGHRWGASVEAASLLLGIHLGMIGLALLIPPNRLHKSTSSLSAL